MTVRDRRGDHQSRGWSNVFGSWRNAPLTQEYRRLRKLEKSRTQSILDPPDRMQLCGNLDVSRQFPFWISDAQIVRE